MYSDSIYGGSLKEVGRLSRIPVSRAESLRSFTKKKERNNRISCIITSYFLCAL